MINEYTENLDQIRGDICQKVLGGLEGLQSVGNFYDLNERLFSNIELHCQLVFINTDSYNKEQMEAFMAGLSTFVKFFQDSCVEMKEIQTIGLQQVENDDNL